MHFAEFLLVGVIVIAICLLELKLLHQRNKMVRPAGRPGIPTTDPILRQSTLHERMANMPPQLRMTIEEAQAFNDKELKLSWPTDPDWYIDFGSIFLSVEEVNLWNITAQKLGNWSEYLFQNIFRANAASAELGNINKPLVEGTALDGTFLSERVPNGFWTKHGVIYGRPYEMKSSAKGDYSFKPDNVRGVVQTNGFFIMCYTHFIPEGIQFDYRGYTFQDVIEMGLRVGEYQPSKKIVTNAKIVAANWLVSGESVVDPTQMRPGQVNIRIRLPGDGGRLISLTQELNGIHPE